jgi:hypothetical protein
MDVTVTIDHWIEKAPREQVRCPGYYAADWEKHVTKPGRYALRLVFVGGYRCPMPYWVLTRIASEVVDGQLFSGYGGLNHSSRKVETGPSEVPVQLYDYMLPDMVKAGQIELLPGMDWALDRKRAMAFTWDEIRQMASREKKIGGAS